MRNLMTSLFRMLFRKRRYLVREEGHPAIEYWTDDLPSPDDPWITVLRDRESE